MYNHKYFQHYTLPVKSKPSPLLCSELRCAPNLVATDRAGGKHLYWKVWIDGELFSETVQPFSASDPWIERYGCPLCDSPGDGSGHISSRRGESYVLWSRPLLEKDNWLASDSGLLPEELFLFDSQQYTNAVGGNLDGLPILTIPEIRVVLKEAFPPPEAASYRNPALASDWSGERLLRKLCYLLDEPKETLYLGPEPASWSELAIGLELPGLPESRWCLGQTDGNLAVLFLAQPRFPIWLYGSVIEKAFSEEQPPE